MTSGHTDNGHTGDDPSSGGGETFRLDAGAYTLTGRRPGAGASRAPLPSHPLIVAIHGGTYTSAYFDVPGFSLLDRAAALGFPIVALDRPGYNGSTPFPPDKATIADNAERLDDAIGRLWNARDDGAPGIVLIGHSIGGAVAVAIAARRPGWTLLGLAVSGVGLAVPADSAAAWAALPDLAMIDLPSALKDQVMFGPAGTFDPVMPERSHIADAPVPRAELIDITAHWPGVVRSLAGKVAVPVHYRQAEHDRLWIVDRQQVAGFAAAFTAAPDVDGRLYPASGHCIDFHRPGEAFQLEQLAFALRCATTRP